MKAAIIESIINETTLTVVDSPTTVDDLLAMCALIDKVDIQIQLDWEITNVYIKAIECLSFRLGYIHFYCKLTDRETAMLKNIINEKGFEHDYYLQLITSYSCAESIDNLESIALYNSKGLLYHYFMQNPNSLNKKILKRIKTAHPIIEVTENEVGLLKYEHYFIYKTMGIRFIVPESDNHIAKMLTLRNPKVNHEELFLAMNKYFGKWYLASSIIHDLGLHNIYDHQFIRDYIGHATKSARNV
jgi:hypothetical protein